MKKQFQQLRNNSNNWEAEAAGCFPIKYAQEHKALYFQIKYLQEQKALYFQIKYSEESLQLSTNQHAGRHNYRATSKEASQFHCVYCKAKPLLFLVKLAHQRCLPPGAIPWKLCYGCLPWDPGLIFSDGGCGPLLRCNHSCRRMVAGVRQEPTWSWNKPCFPSRD